MKKQFKAFAVTFTLVSAFNMFSATLAKAGCAAIYKKRSEVYINISATASDGSSIVISRPDNGPDIIRHRLVRASEILSQAQTKDGGAELNKLVRQMMRKHPHATASLMDATVRSILIDAEKENLFCRDEDKDGEADLTSLHRIKKHVRQEVLARLHPDVTGELEEMGDLDEESPDCPAVDRFLMKEKISFAASVAGDAISEGTHKVVEGIKKTTHKIAAKISAKTAQ